MTREKAIQLLKESNQYLQQDVVGKEWDDNERKYVEKTYKFIDTAKFEFKIGNEQPSVEVHAKLSDGTNIKIESLEKIVNYFKLK